MCENSSLKKFLECEPPESEFINRFDVMSEMTVYCVAEISIEVYMLTS